MPDLNAAGGDRREPLFTRAFALLFCFSFVTFFSAFQFFPVMPLRILDLHGTTAQAGWFLGLYTFASAFSAPLMGSIADQFGRRRYLVCGSACFIAFAGLYSAIPSVPLLVATAALQGVVWSGLLAASGALFSDAVPVSRRAEGFSYWGFASTGAVAIAPAIGLKVYQAGWHWLCLETAVLSGLMVLIALVQHERPRERHRDWRSVFGAEVLDRRVFLAALSLFMVSFGNGGINSYIVLYCKSANVRPESIFFTVFAVTTMLVRLFSGRLADAVGHTRALLPSLGLAAVGLGILALPVSLTTVVASALFFGAGFGTCYPSFAAYMLGVTDPARRAQTFGSILAAFDTGIGMGSIVLGAVVARYGFRPAFGLAAVIALFAIPFFLLTERGLRRAHPVKAGPPISPGGTRSGV